mmetsp:Transcript_12792/g.19337  ORF Transcript_12792/g.19337 Transcript_12792/m.19337 type:complete len:184 (-) Transcript_12792:286-837(-)
MCGDYSTDWSEYCLDMGYCFYSMSTVSVLNEASGHEEIKRIKDIKVGDKILAKGAQGLPVFKPVKALPHSKAREDYVEIKMGKGPSQLIQATKHHTMSMCNGKTKLAMNVKSGDCIMTPGGKEHVHKASKVPRAKTDVTYTIEMEHGVDQIAVGGVYTHTRSYLASSEMPAWTKHLDLHSKKK